MMMENYKDLQQFGVRNCILVLKHICLCYLHKILVKAKILGLDKKKQPKCAISGGSGSVLC